MRSHAPTGCTALAALGVVSSVLAQNPCPEGNTGCTSPFANGNANVFALIMPQSPNPLLVRGFQLKTLAITAAHTTQIEVYLPDANGQPKIPAAGTGSMSISTNYQFHTGMLTAPLLVPANTTYFIAFANAGMRHPICGSGGTPTSYYWHPPTATTWNGTFNQAWTYRVIASGCTSAGIYELYGTGCRGTAGVAALSNTGVPEIGKSFSVDLANAPANLPSLMVLGFSNTMWGALQLPLDLGVIGASGCSLLASLDFTLVAVNSAGGTRMQTLAIPSDTALRGANFYNQFVVVDPPANSLGMVTSNAGKATVGG